MPGRLDALVSSLVRVEKGGGRAILNDVIFNFQEVSLYNLIGVLRYIRERKCFSSTKHVWSLCLAEARRRLHEMGPNEFTDIICFTGAARGLGSEFFLPRFPKMMKDLSGDQLALVAWAARRGGHSQVVGSIMSYIESDAKIIASMKLKSKALLLNAAELHSDRLVELLDLSTDIKRTNSLQALAVVLHAISPVRSGLVHNLFFVDIVPRLNYLLRLEKRISIQSLLSIAHSFSVLNFKSQPLVVDVYRHLYSRSNQLSNDQSAFALYLFSTASGIRDAAIAESLVCQVTNPAKLSNNNLINLFTVLGDIANSEDLLEVVVREIQTRQMTLKPAQLVSASAVLSDAVEVRMHELNLSDLTRLFTSGNAGDEELKWKLQREFVGRIKKGGGSANWSLWNADDLISIAAEIRRLGPWKIKSNFRVRFNGIFILAIKNRLIPTSTVLKNLSLIDDIGTWHCLPHQTQLALWSKASDVQKTHVRPPLDPHRNDPIEVRRRRINSKKLLVRVGHADVIKPIDSSGKPEPPTIDEEALELRSFESSPNSDFIHKLRNS